MLMHCIMRFLRGAGLLGCLALTSIPARSADIIEYYNASLDHYFITWVPAEIANLDSGKTKGWTRTGQAFPTFTSAQAGTSPVCRFYIPPALGDSHFFGRGATECGDTGQKNPSFVLESSNFMYMYLPAAGICPASTAQVYRVFSNRPDANHRYMVSKAVRNQMIEAGWLAEGDGPDMVVMCAPNTATDIEADAARLLEQSTMGPTEALIREVAAKGVAPWINEQLAMNITRYSPQPFFMPSNDPLQCVDDNTPPVTPEKFCQTNRQQGTPVAWEFFRQAKTAPDQLRLRMGHVWHQIFVTQWEGFAYGVAEFQQLMRDHAFDTFENLLLKYALSPKLGHFQNWVRNVPEHDGIRPNENFARELMQLFTIGVNALNDDGTPKRDGNGRLIPNYTQADIETVARILTGFTFPTMPGNTPSWNNPDYFIGDMIPFDTFHDMGAKTALDERLVLPAGGGAMAEVRTLIRVLIDHPSAPPFISKQIIQKMVTSSPTPAYVARVVSVFKDNGNGVRGDLAAVVRAILLDPEARGPRKTEPEYGRLREPALFWTAMIRALDIVTDGYNPASNSRSSGQNLFFPATVFSYYPADFTLPGTNVPAPEFGIFSTTEFINRSNQLTHLIFQPGGDPDWLPKPFVPNATGTPPVTFAAFLTDAGDADVLVERLNRLFLHGAMSAAMRKTVVNAVNKVPANNPLLRTKIAVRLILGSVDYQVQK